MAQNDFGNLSSPLNGTTFFDSKLEPWRDTLHSMHSGTSRPSYAVAGLMWLDTTTTPWIIKVFDGTDDITIGTVNATTNIFTPAGIILNNIAATVAPTANEDSGDGYSAGSLWVNLTTDLAYICVDASSSAAIWKNLVDTNSTQALSGKSFASITVTGGSITGITDLALADGGTGASTAAGARDNLIISQHETPGGRLTLTTGLPVTLNDVTGASTLYYTPYQHNVLWLYTAAAWKPYVFTERSLALSGLTSGRPYDVFIYDNSGTLTLELLAWTNDTTRATALVRQDGVLCKTGALDRRYLGTIYTTATTTTEDSAAKRFVWNMYNRVRRAMRVADSTSSWTYSTASWRQANGAAANQLDFVLGVAEESIYASVQGSASNSTTTARACFVGMALDSTSSADANSRLSTGLAANFIFSAATRRAYNPDVGRHYIAWLEQGAGTDTQTWYGGGSQFLSGQIQA